MGVWMEFRAVNEPFIELLRAVYFLLHIQALLAIVQELWIPV
jgi:hypothetical protein